VDGGVREYGAFSGQAGHGTDYRSVSDSQRQAEIRRSPPAEIDVFGSPEDRELQEVAVRRNNLTVRDRVPNHRPSAFPFSF